MAFIKLMFSLVLFALACGAFVSIVIFAIDVLKWHDKESKVEVIPSNLDAPDGNSENTIEESGVIDNVDESGEYNTSIIPFARSES